MKMRRRTKSICLSMTFFCLAIASKAFALDYGPYFDFTNAYRVGDVSCLIQQFNPSPNPIGSDSFKINNIQIYQLGVDTRLPICNEWYVRGVVNYGWVLGGNVIEKLRTGVGIAAAPTELLANIDNGDVFDSSLGLGFLYPILDGWRMGMIGGWSYNFQRFKLEKFRDATTAAPFPDLEGVTYKQFWNGPWIGIETLFSTFWHIDANVGVEYHWPKWRADFDLLGPDVIGGSFSDHRNAPIGNAQVAYINLKYYPNTCWDLGLQFKYQHWEITSGHELPRAGTFPDVGLPATEVDRIPLAFWWAFDIQFSLGYVW